jgi:MFS family permease
LWGLVLLMNFYHFSDIISAEIIMCLFAGLTIGLPLWGKLADHYNHPAWIIILGAGVSFLIAIMMLVSRHNSATFIAILFLGLGFFSSCQTLGFTWLTKNMHPELIGLNSAFNSMLFMGSNGGFKQLAAILIASSPLLHGTHAVGNLLIFTAVAMLLSAIYASIRHFIFQSYFSGNQLKH